MKRMKSIVVVMVALVFLMTALAAQAGTFQIKPKGDKKIKIGVLDLISAVEVAALANGYYKKWATARGWDLQVFDINLDFSKAQTVMENMITAGYDGIIVNWTDFKYYAPQVKKAYDKGIPVVGIACGNNVPGVVSHGIAPEPIMAAQSALYLASKLKEGDKVILYYAPTLNTHVFRINVARPTFEAYKIKIAQEIQAPPTGDPYQVPYDQVKNALLADATKKEIKGIWTTWEGSGVSAARAAHDMGRSDILVTTCDDAPGTYARLADMPNLVATAGANGDAPNWTLHLFKTFDKIFKGEAYPDLEIWYSQPQLVTKENLPPKGYFFNACGYEGRQPDYRVPGAKR